MLRHGKERLWLWEDDQGFVQVSQILEQNAFSHGGFTEKDLWNTVLSSKSYKGFRFQWKEGDENFGPGIKALKPCDQWNHWEGERTAGGLPLNHCSAKPGKPKTEAKEKDEGKQKASGFCFAYQHDQCQRAETCRFLHEWNEEAAANSGNANAAKICRNCRKEGHCAWQCAEPQKCRRCGTEDHHNADCPNMDEKCGACGKVGHVESMCHSKGKSGGKGSHLRKGRSYSPHRPVEVKVAGGPG